MKQYVAQQSFVSGELSPDMYGRSDIRAYNQGAARLTNCRPLFSGAVGVRWGFKYLNACYGDGYLASFRRDEDAAFVVAFTHQRVTFYDRDGIELQTITGCPWTSAILNELRWTQAGDIMIVVHESFAPQEIERTGATTWALAAFAYENADTSIPIARYAPTGVTVTLGAVSGATTLTTSANFWTAGMVGEIVKVETNPTGTSDIIYATITGYVSPTVVNATIGAAYTATGVGPHLDWWSQAFSAVWGYPSAVCMHGQRLIFGGSTELPDMVWGSKVAAIYNFDVGTAEANEGIAFEMNLSEKHKIRHLVSSRSLIILTNLSYYFVPESDSRPFTPANFSFRFIASYGTANARPALFDQQVLVVARNGSGVRELVYDDNLQNFRPDLVSLLASHIVTGVRDSCTIEGPNDRPEQLSVFARDTGELAVFHSIRAQEVTAWFEWTTNGDFRSVTAIEDDLYALVQRTLNGSTVYCLERMEEGTYLDCSIPLSSGTPTDTFTVTRLAGEPVWAVDGNYSYGQHTVSGAGQLVIDQEITSGEAGFSFDWEIKMLPVSFDRPNGNVRSRPLRIVKMGIDLLEARAIQVSSTALVLRTVEHEIDEIPPDYDGWAFFNNLGWDRRYGGMISITRDTPLRATVRHIVREVVHS